MSEQQGKNNSLLNRTSQLSLRRRFMLGLGAMLMPFFFMAGTTLIFFEQAITSFELAQSQDLEARFSIAELKNYFGQVRPDVNALLIRQGQPQRLKNLEAIHTEIIEEIDNILEQSPSPLQANLLKGVGESWQKVYDEIQSPMFENESSSISTDRLDSIQTDLEAVQQGLDRIDGVQNEIQFEEGLALANQLKKRERILIGFVTLLAISIALFTAIMLSRSIIQSMQTLIAGLENLSEGKLNQRINWHTDDEFGRIANAINRMAEKLDENQQALIKIATVDALTGVFNRREFNRLLTIEIERSRRDLNPVSMVMVDIDHFKSINDTYGHQSGDDALQWISAILKEEIRPGDIAARYGGEEFALILPKTHSADAGIVAERIRHKIESGVIPIQDGLKISVTASFGCATFPYAADSEEKLMSAADGALYRAKETGRNQVCYAQPSRALPSDQYINADRSA